jgi:hypothetical protein
MPAYRTQKYEGLFLQYNYIVIGHVLSKIKSFWLQVGIGMVIRQEREQEGGG